MKKMKSSILTFFLFVLFVVQAIAQVFPTIAIQDNGDVNKRINFVYLAEGYTAVQQPTFQIDAARINTDLFAQTPFSNYINFFNAYRIEVPSTQSGADHPGNATDVTEPSHPVQSVSTYFNSTFDYFNIHRLLVPTNGTAITNVLASNLPQYDQAFIVVNSPHYGGSGGQFATSSTEASSSEVAIHEIGHSFAGLSDEYWAGDFYAGENHNMTQETNPTLVRWDEWHGTSGVGIYQHCCGGTSSSWYRPHQNCKMQYLGAPFCAVCRQRLIDVIYSLVTPIDAYSPTAAAQTYGCGPMTFDLDMVYPTPNTLEIEWILNGSVVSTNLETISLSSSQLNAGMNTLVAKVTDKTTLSRSYLPNDGYEFTVSWTIDNTPPPNVLQVDAKTYLQGTFSSGLMKDDLRVNGLIPTKEPFTAMSYTHVGGGGESIAPSVLAVTGNDAIVDWVLLEIRDETTPSMVLASRSVLVQRDGDIVDLDGVSPVSFECLGAANYHIAVRHRNHLGVMTGAPVLFN